MKAKIDHILFINNVLVVFGKIFKASLDVPWYVFDLVPYCLDVEDQSPVVFSPDTPVTLHWTVFGIPRFHSLTDMGSILCGRGTFHLHALEVTLSDFSISVRCKWWM